MFSSISAEQKAVEENARGAAARAAANAAGAAARAEAARPVNVPKASSFFGPFGSLFSSAPPPAPAPTPAPTPTPRTRAASPLPRGVGGHRTRRRRLTRRLR